jgi:type IV pilus assembly protein PilA
MKGECWMFQRFHEKLQEREGGFTLIELLVVVLIIAILAAIAIPVFLRQREKAYVADTQSTLRNAATAAESWSTLNEGSYVGFATPLPGSQDFQDVREAGTATLTVPDETATGYCIQVVDTRLTGHEWATGHFDSTVGKPESGAC